MSKKHTWRAIPESEMRKGSYLGYIEFKIERGKQRDEHIYFEIYNTPRALVFGGSTNTGFLQSGYMIKDNVFSLDVNLQELLADLEVYYNDGPSSVSRIITNARM